ncbi:acyl-CoA dehydrogenase family protein [Fodinicola acaciae]|uniref:acyl-CoA dehydrogenase family protein n=1 Tax=Fodinicola acaciae TaxID=2681555 RepID=UPI0013D62CE1|nr:acyl-CoA dehydrogenase family protein [Fodinicola acaciae]
MKSTLVQTARALVPLLREHAAAADRDRRLAAETVAALRDAGLFRLAVPRKYGGHEADIRTIVGVTAELAQGCASAAWVTMILAGASFVAAHFPARTREEIWAAGADTTVCASTSTTDGVARRVDGGLVVSGQWHYASGVHQATWALLAGASLKGTDDRVVSIVPVSELRIKDTWQVAGMRGTASDTMVADEIFVPEHRQFSFARLMADYLDEYADEPLYRTPTPSLLAILLTGPMLGMAEAALSHVLAAAKTKPLMLTTYARQADAPSVQLAIADATALIDTARLHAFRSAGDLDQAARDGVRLDTVVRARIRMDTGYAGQRLRDAVDLLLNVSGAGSFAEANPLQRIWRDLETASRHVQANTNVSREIYGRALLGVEEKAVLVI